MLKKLFPPRKCIWCRNDMDAGQMICRACGGNRVVPALWWPVTVASTLALTVAVTALVLVLLAFYREDRLSQVSPTAVSPAAAAPTDTVSPAQAAGQETPAAAGESASLMAGQNPFVAESPLSTPEPADAPVLAATSTPMPEPTSTPIPEPTSTLPPEPTSTPIPEPTSTLPPEPTSTWTPEPTATLTPIPVPDPRFRADQTTMGAGGCTNLRWDIDGVRGVYLDGAGRPGHSVEEVCPEVSHTYLLTVVMPDGRETYYPLHIEMIGYRPLTLGVLVTYRGCDTTEAYRAEVSIWAQGGDKQYTYYLGDLDHYLGGPTDKGMVHRVSWRTCGGMPGIAIVRSGDGQEAQQPFWVDAPACCGPH